MTHVYVLLLALGIGAVAGLRSMTAPAVLAWSALLHGINLQGHGWASWLGHPVAVGIITALAVGELVVDKLPKTPSRTAPPSFIARIALGAFTGAAIGSHWGYTWTSLGAGVIGAVLGTMGGYEARTRLVAAHGHDLPIALLEDAVAVLGGFAVVAVTAAL